MQQRFGLLRRMGLAPAFLAQALAARADREQPVRAHLQIFVQRLHRLVIEGVARLGPHRCPDQSLMRVGEAPPAKVRHRIRFPPHHVVQHPEAEILKDGTDAEDVVVAADHPEAGVRLQHAAAGGKPFAGEGVIGGEAAELVPVVVDGIDAAIVRPVELVVELEIIGRVGEHEIDRGFGEELKLLDAVADDDPVERELGSALIPHAHDTTRVTQLLHAPRYPARRSHAAGPRVKAGLIGESWLDAGAMPKPARRGLPLGISDEAAARAPGNAACGTRAGSAAADRLPGLRG